jgi:predicted small lipoprotein YifL
VIRLMLVVTVLALAACGDRDPLAEGKRAYQGKPDSRAWDNTPLPYEQAKWTKGDRASWVAQIKGRQLTQDEHKRIGQ